MFILNLAQYILAFVLIWIGSGLIVSSTSKFSKKLGLSSFAVSFILLGLLTSTPEFSVGLQAVIDNTPEIFIGNLLGGLVVIFLLIIPILAIFGNGISLKNEMGNKTLLLTLAVILAPSIAVFDRNINIFEGGILISLYFLLLYVFQKEFGLFDSKKESLLDTKAYSHKDIIKIIAGVLLVLGASHIIVTKTIFFADLFNIPVFYISLIVIALGTNLPELTLTLRSVLAGTKDVAMGDYLGSAVINTFFFGLFIWLSGGSVQTTSNFLVTFGFIAGGVLAFYFFSVTKGRISRLNGFFLLLVYIGFLAFEITRH